jgi:transcriptional regulator of arginine metabolism
LKKKDNQALGGALKALLLERKASTQEEICLSLTAQGFDINQSRASRLLRKIGAIKIQNEKGQIVYSLPKEPIPPSMESALTNLIVDVSANEVMVVVITKPGSASLVARLLDFNQLQTEILGTIPGDDTIFVSPKSIKNIPKMLDEVKKLLSSITL